ncbi:MAG: peptidylprolyl isomerase [Bacteroidota bacterium]|jgi:peptidylprolyl isomerase
MKKLLIVTICLALTKQVFSQKDTLVEIKTSQGNIVVKLYEKTPLHRANFIRLVKKGFYDSLIFHRIIPTFMIQGGDPDSKRAASGAMLGNGGPGYTIPAEILPEYFHKKGALAGARLGDDVNPTKASSGSQFYLVQGKVFTEAELTQMAQRMSNMKRQQNGQKLYQEYLNRPENAALLRTVIRLQQAQNRDSLELVSKAAIEYVNSQLQKIPDFSFTPEQIKAYSTLGGAPHLDGGYTVFGEVVEGLDVIDKIATLDRDSNDRPKNDVRMFPSLKISKK